MATYQARAGKVRAIVRRKGFKPKSRTFPSKSAAKVWADRIERELAEIEAVGDTDDSRISLADLIRWQETELRDLKVLSSTQRGNLTRIRENLGQIQVNRLTAAHIIEHAKKRVTGHHTRENGIRIPACSPATINVELGYLSELLKLAQSMGKLRLKNDPVRDARPALRMLKLVSKAKKRDRRPSADELKALREHFVENRWRMRIPMAEIVEFAILSAKREGEITRLLWSDLDEANRTALVRDAKHPRAKIGNHKRFPLLGNAWKIVSAQPRTDERIFPYKSESVGNAFREACKRLHIKDLHFHDLRHEAASRLFEQGYSIEQVAAVTLHESWNELKRYTQLRPESLHRDTKQTRANAPSDG